MPDHLGVGVTAGAHSPIRTRNFFQESKVHWVLSFNLEKNLSKLKTNRKLSQKCAGRNSEGRFSWDKRHHIKEAKEDLVSDKVERIQVVNH